MTLRQVAPHGPELHSGLALLSRRSRVAFSSCGMSNTATDSAAEGNPLWHRSLQRQTYSASQKCSPGWERFTTRLDVAKLNIMLSSDGLEIGTGSSNSPRSTIQSIVFCTFWRIARNPRVCADLRLRMDPENVSCSAIRRNQAKVIRSRFC